MKKTAILGILAALAALGAVLVMSGVVYAGIVTGPGSAHAASSITAPGTQDISVTSGGSAVEAVAYIDNGSSGDASATANATNDPALSTAHAGSQIYGSGSDGNATSVANSSATGASEADTWAESEIASGATGTVNSLANASAINGGSASAVAVAVLSDGAYGNNTAYAYANSTGADALSNTNIETGDETPASGFYYGVYSSGDSYALAFLFVITPNNIMGFTYTNAASTDAYADIVVNGSDTPIVIASGVIPP